MIDLEDHKRRYRRFQQNFLSNQIKQYLSNHYERESNKPLTENIKTDEYLMARRLKKSIINTKAPNNNETEL